MLKSMKFLGLSPGSCAEMMRSTADGPAWGSHVTDAEIAANDADLHLGAEITDAAAQTVGNFTG